MRKIRIGSRDSRLAAAQAKIICDLLQQNHPKVQLELVTMKTTGDRVLDMGLETIGEKVMDCIIGRKMEDGLKIG